jgi:hypothetical protein
MGWPGVVRLGLLPPATRKPTGFINDPVIIDKTMTSGADKRKWANNIKKQSTTGHHQVVDVGLQQVLIAGKDRLHE